MLYIATIDHRGYRYEKNDPLMRDTANDGSRIINFDEAIQVVRRAFFMSDYNWNGTPLKLARKYKWDYTKYEKTLQIKKEDLSLKDGKLYYQGAVFEKTDEKKLGKIKEEWKNKLIGQLGKETKISVNGLKGATAVPTKITIVENGKEEVFE